MKKSSFLSLLRFASKGEHDGDMHRFGPLQGNVRSFLAAHDKAPAKNRAIFKKTSWQSCEN